MIRLALSAVLALLSFPALAQDYQAVTTSNAVVRQAPGPDFAQIGVIPTGTTVSVAICFARGSFCAVDWAAAKGFVSGDLLSVGGQTVRNIEAAKWAAIDTNSASSLPDWEASNIVVWGDSLSTNTFGTKLESLLLGRKVSMQGVPGEDGAKIAARRLATTRFDKRITIIWDRHYTRENPATYMADLQPIFDRLKDDRYVVISDIRSLSADLDVDQDKAITSEINGRLRQAHPDNFLDVTSEFEAPSTRTDGLHLTKPAYDTVAKRIAEFIQKKGW